MHAIKEIDSSQLAAWLSENPEAIRLVDVRSPAEMAQGILPGAEPMPLHLVPLHEAELRASDRPVVIYCRTGARSAQACMYLAARDPGTDYINLRGGIVDWARQGFEIVLPQAEQANA